MHCILVFASQEENGESPVQSAFLFTCNVFDMDYYLMNLDFTEFPGQER